jgi:carbonic anhydrase
MGLNCTGLKWTLILCTASIGAFSQGAAEWGYSGPDGPSHWGELSPEYSTCKMGREQSPINIGGGESTTLPPIRFDYKSVPLKLVNNGHTVQVNYATGSTITVGADQYELKQLHFHRPSEDKISGHTFDMEIHLVHANARGELAVIAVLVEKGAANKAIQNIWAAIPKGPGPEREIRGSQTNASDFLPANSAYFTYRGSLTTPPCTEGVTWFVLKTPITISAEQVKAFGAAFRPNARPVQSLGSRLVKQQNR